MHGIHQRYPMVRYHVHHGSEQKNESHLRLKAISPLSHINLLLIFLTFLLEQLYAMESNSLVVSAILKAGILGFVVGAIPIAARFTIVTLKHFF